ncbi:MAG TPA: DUF4926 domain-containing protein [Pyrinomonadaceae bacterium]|nr:DUF4926 domain-containing protein [Acidobacteriota bacterium]HQZ95117.1 DUF4926 domain-containing protein [Pyrinomonadaceae bacterium]
MKKPEMFDSVALIEDLPEAGLVRGNMGAIVESYHDGEAYEVEFVDTDGQTYGLLALRPEQFIVLHRSSMEKIAA